MKSTLAQLTTVGLLLVFALVGSSLASIDNEPVKVTHRNSGPSYDINIDDVEKARAEINENRALPTALAPPAETDNNNDKDDQPIGHLTIRRIFLVPVMSPSQPEPTSANRWNSEPEEPHPMMRNPFWPFQMGPSRHLFGADSASRSPTAEASDERPSTSVERETIPQRDPMRMLLEMMHQAFNPEAMAANFPPSDLNKEASGDANEKKLSGETDKSPAAEQDKPVKPVTKNEAKEEIVEIDGKKYLRKTVVNHHIGENIVFMTKRLIFVPLNETEGETSTTTTVAPSLEMTTSKILSDDSDKKLDEPTTTVASNEPSSTESVTTQTPSSTTTGQAETSTTLATNVEETTAKDSTAAEKPADVINKVAERLMEAVSTSTAATPTTTPTTDKPVVTTQA